MKKLNYLMTLLKGMIQTQYDVDTRSPKAKFHNNGTTLFTAATIVTNNSILLLNC